MEEAVKFLEKFSRGEKACVKEETITQLRSQMRNQVFYDPNLPRILVIGRFNAGKSTLVNALVNKKVAATDCFEKTAWVSRFWPTEEAFCELTLKNQEKKEIGLEEFLENTEKDRYSKEQLSNIERVDIGCADCNINYALIDSPGFGSVNEDNEKMALDALKDADLVIYIVNVTKLGNLREESIVNEIRSSKIPMICVGSFYDGDIAEDLEYDEVVNMIARNTGFETDKIFATSAAGFLRGTLSDEESGMTRLRDYLKNIAINNVTYRQNAAAAKEYRLLNQIVFELNQVQGQLAQIKQMQECFVQEYDYIHARIRNKLADFIRSYVKDTLYVEYKEQIIHMIQLLQKDHSGSVDPQEVIMNLIPSDYMERYWERLSEAVSAKMVELWKEYLGEMDDYQVDMKALFQENAIIGSLDFKQMDAVMNAGYSESLARQGVKMSFSMAGLASAYEAWLGVHAATVALGGAIFSTGVPILLMGMGLTWLAVKSKDTETTVNTDVRSVLENNIASFSEKVIEYAISKMEAVDIQIKTIYTQQISDKINRQLPEKESVDTLIACCNGYVERVSDRLDQISYTDIEVTVIQERPEGNVFENRFKEIVERLDPIIHDSRNRFKIEEEKDPDLTQFAPLVFMDENLLNEFLETLQELLLGGNEFIVRNQKNTKQLVDDNYIYTNGKKYRIYFHIDPMVKEIYIRHIEHFLKMDECLEMRKHFIYEYTLNNDQIRNKILDLIAIAQKEIIMVCPWVTLDAWEKNKGSYAKSIKEAVVGALSKNPDLHLIMVTGYDTNPGNDGMSESSRDKNTETLQVVNRIEKELEKYKKQVRIFKNVGLHIKLFTVDNVCALKGSLNYLSNQGIYSTDEVTGKLTRTMESMDVKMQLNNVENARRSSYEYADIAFEYRPFC